MFFHLEIAMPSPSLLRLKDGTILAYHKTPASAKGKGLPGLIFLGGFLSDMEGAKALFLETLARREGFGFIRFDYSGHGKSSGAFEEGTIGTWTQDTIAILDRVAKGPHILVGSSMGGWIMLLAALKRKKRIAGLIGIAAAPDFTEYLMWKKLTAHQKKTLRENGRIALPPDACGDPDARPYPITLQLIEEARKRLLLRSTIPLTCPVTLLHGMKDADVPYRTALSLAEKLQGADVEIRLQKSGDHRMSTPESLMLLEETVRKMQQRHLS